MGTEGSVRFSFSVVLPAPPSGYLPPSHARRLPRDSAPEIRETLARTDARVVGEHAERAVRQ